MALVRCLVLTWMVSGISYTKAITTTHHDKPDTIITPSTTADYVESSTAPVLVNFNVTMSTLERKKRLLPYQNFYFDQPFNRPHKAGVSAQQYKDYQEVRKPSKNPVVYQQQKFTPFLESNALPGAFRPIMNHQSHQPSPYYQESGFIEVDDQPPPPSDFSAIYDKLAQLKLRQHAMRQKAPYGYRLVPQYRFRERPPKIYDFRYNNVQPTKTTIETFTATNIDIPEKVQEAPQEPIRYHQISTPATPPRTQYRENVKPYVHQQVAFEVPQSSLPLTYPSGVGRKQRPKTYILIQPKRPAKQQQTILVRKPKPVAIIEENYVAEKYVPVVFTKPQPETPPKQYEIQYQATPAPPPPQYEQNFQVVEPPRPEEEYYRYPVTSTPLPVTQNVEEQYLTVSPSVTPKGEDSSLGDLLKHLQETNALPPTLTADNIDNSIKTLMRILDALKDRQKQQKPVVVQDEYEYDNEAGVDLGGDAPLDTPAGGTPGRPGVDYPALSNIPKTTFSCKTQRYKGFFGDPDTNCQVWHYCDLNGGQASFLCPNGTIFSQVALTCDWWFNVKCASTPQLYVLNERLYKYIIPLSPKFPEDYSGPLVDKYLAMKFQEMEEKMRKQKKGKNNSDSEESTETDDDSSFEEESDQVNSDEGTETTTITDVNKL